MKTKNDFEKIEDYYKALKRMRECCWATSTSRDRMFCDCCPYDKECLDP